MKPALVVLAKAPVAGRVKTRLCPPCTPVQAARLARAALEDTLAAADATIRPARHVVVLDGEAGSWLPPSWEVLPQRPGGLGDRLAGAFARVGDPALIVGMDTPQVTPALLDAGLAQLEEGDAVFGPAHDGGYWAIGLRRPNPAVFAGVPMSDARTGAVQRARLAALGLRVGELPPLHDVDSIADARLVAGTAPSSRFAIALNAIEPRPPAVTTARYLPRRRSGSSS